MVNYQALEKLTESLDTCTQEDLAEFARITKKCMDESPAEEQAHSVLKSIGLDPGQRVEEDLDFEDSEAIAHRKLQSIGR